MFDISKEINRPQGNALHLVNCIENADKIVDLYQRSTIELKDTRIGKYRVYHTGLKNIDDQFVFNEISRVTRAATEKFCEYYKRNISEYIVEDEVYWIKTWDFDVNIGLHSDSWEDDGEVKVPSLTVVLYLTEDFEGGEIGFPKDIVVVNEPPYFETRNPDLDEIIKPKTGDILVFDSKMIHYVNKVTSGLRIATDLAYMK